MLAAAVLTIGVTACGGEGGGDESAGDERGAGGLTEIIVATGGMSPLDPNRDGELAILSLIGAALTTNSSGPDGGKPDLAESFVESADGRQWTAKLRPDAKFSDGTPVTADDVVASFKRIMKDDAAPQAAWIESVTDVKASAPDTVVFDVRQPTPALPQLISFPWFAIFPADGLAVGEKFFKRPVSAGPYKIDSYSPKRGGTLSQNEHYHGAKSAIRQIRFENIGDAGARLAVLKQGRAHYALELAPAQISQMTGDVKPAVVTLPGSIEMIMNNEDPLLSDVRIRQAINLAVDRSAINTSAFGGHNVVQSGYWPSTFPYFDEEAQQATADVEGAKQLLEGTECADGCTISMMYVTDFPWSTPTALIVEQNLKEIGIQLKLDGIDSATAYPRGENGQFQINLNAWTGVLPVAESLSPVNLKPSGAFKAGFSRYESAEMDALVDELLAAPLDEREPIAAEIDTLWREDQPWVNLVDYGLVNATIVPPELFRQDVLSLKAG